MSDLCFSRTEMSHLLSSTYGWSPSALALEQLDTVTEGWAAALVLIAMALRQEVTTSDFDQSLQRQLASYSRTQRHLFEYFAAEVLAQQSLQTRDFLLDTCVLGQLEPNICTVLLHDLHHAQQRRRTDDEVRDPNFPRRRVREEGVARAERTPYTESSLSTPEDRCLPLRHQGGDT